ncbi:MAG: hydroxyacylglutathione hydrolase [Thermodesulfobacteriota bacterium]
MYISEYDNYNIYRFNAGNSEKNYQYLIKCNETSECVVIDPLEPLSLLSFIRENGLRVADVLNTHGHPDHIEGNNAIIKVFLDSKILIHKLGLEFVAPRAKAIDEGDVIRFGNQTISVLHTPGHCPEHVSFIIDDNIFVGDTVFVSGCGNTSYRGDVDVLFDTFNEKIRNLDDNLNIFCGHDYAANNLEYTLSIDPNNTSIRNKIESINGSEEVLSTIGEERKYNPFMRFDNTEIIDNLKEKNPDMDTDGRSVFTKLRELRNNW